VLTAIRLPILGLGSGQTPFAWPRPTTPWQIAHLQNVCPPQRAPDPAEIAEIEAAGGGMVGQIIVRNRRAGEESARVAAFYERQERGREGANIADAAEARRRNGM
jgi:hypothetical protein